jgi:hypothetical protein
MNVQDLDFEEALEKTQQIFGPPETELGETELEAERDEVADLKRLAVLRLKADLPKRKPPTQRQPIQGNIGRGL